MLIISPFRPFSHRTRCTPVMLKMSPVFFVTVKPNRSVRNKVTSLSARRGMYMSRSFGWNGRRFGPGTRHRSANEPDITEWVRCNRANSSKSLRPTWLSSCLTNEATYSSTIFRRDAEAVPSAARSERWSHERMEFKTSMLQSWRPGSNQQREWFEKGWLTWGSFCKFSLNAVFLEHCISAQKK